MVVDRDDHHDHPLFSELLAVTQHPVADVAHRAVDVDVPGGHLAVSLDALGAQRDGIAVFAQQHVGRRDAHGSPRRAWCTRCRYSPWTGTKHSGLVTCMRVCSSPALACPLTCTASVPECTTSAPRRCNSSMTRPTDHSLPGMGWALMTTTSSEPMRSHLLSPVAMRDRADMGSPCEPVEMTHISPGGTVSTCSMSIWAPSGTLMKPSRVPSSTFLPIDRPKVATLRPFAVAAS